MALIKNRLVTNISLIVAVILVIFGLMLAFNRVQRVEAEEGESITSGLVGWWKHNHTSGTSTSDSSTSGITGTLANNENADWDGNSATCTNNTRSLNFDNNGSAPYEQVDMGAQAALNPTSLTISTWVMIDDFSDDAGIINNLDNTGDYGGYALTHASDGFFNFMGYWGVGSSDSLTLSSAGQINTEAGEWYHVIVTYNGSTGVARMYVDGISVDDTNFGDDPAQPLSYDANTFTLGNITFGSPKPLDGKIDDTRVYNRVVTSSEIKTLARTNCDDGDNIPMSTEDAAPNNGDGNNDGYPDAEQANVTSLPNTVAGGSAYQTVESNGGCETFAYVDVVDELDQELQDEAYDYPAGLTEFTLTCDSPGDSATIEIFYDQVYDQETFVLRKVIDEAFTDVAGAVFSVENIDGVDVTKVTYTVTDGGTYDLDGTVNGTIYDPAGVAQVDGASNIAEVPDTGFGPVSENKNAHALLLIITGLIIISLLSRQISIQKNYNK